MKVLYKVSTYEDDLISSCLNMLNKAKMSHLFWSLSIFCLIHCVYCNDFVGPVATYEEVDDAINHPEQYLIDLRTIERIKKDGSIPGSVIIPFDELEAALNMDNNEFYSKYGFEKPSKDTSIIFICLGGRILARLATNMAKEKGYSRSKPYVGSWLAWFEGRKSD